MYKVIRGKLVDIEDTRILELAIQGTHRKRTLNKMNSIYTPIVWKTVDFYISMYKMYYKMLPYPISNIESDIKYVALGNLIMDTATVSTTNIYISDGLHIEIEGTDIEILFIGDSYVLQHKSNTGKLEELESYKNNEAYCMYSWFVEYMRGLNVSENDCKQKFYIEFYKDIFTVCDNNADEVVEELKAFLNTYSLNNIQCKKIRDNYIVDLDDSRELTLDLYFSSRCKTGETESVITVDSTTEDKDVYINTYRYKAYSKEVDKELKEVNLIGLNYIFNRVCGIRNRDDSNTFEDFKGILVDRKIVYELDKHIYLCKAYRVCEEEEIAKHAQLLGYSNGEIYYKVTGKDTDLTRIAVYKYSLGSKNTELCGIQFIGGDVISV